MAKASVTGTISVISNGTTYYSTIQSQLGDIYQTYLGTSSAPTNIYPDFEADGATKPILVLLVYSAETGGLTQNVTNQNTKWFINETEIKFDSGGVSTNLLGGVTGHFQKTTQNIGGVEVPALIVRKNLVKVSDGMSFLIKAQASVAIVNSAVTLTASYPVSISFGTENTKKVTIIAGDTNYFNITSKLQSNAGYSCKLKAWVDNKDTTGTDYTFKWFIEENGKWVMQAETSAIFTITEPQVNTASLVKLEVYKDDDLYGMDVQTVLDTSDPYKISPNPIDPSTGLTTIEQFTRGDGKTIRYTPILWNNENGKLTKIDGQKFIMSFYDNAGNLIKNFDTPATSFDVTGDEENGIVSHGGAVYIIQTSD